MKPCKKCGYDRFLLYSSISKKSCGKCGSIDDWELKDGQNPTVSNNRIKAK